MELPHDEKDDKEMVGVPETLEMGTAVLLHRVPNHDTQSDIHDPTRCSWTCGEVGNKPSYEPLDWRLGGRVESGEVGKVDEMGKDVNA